MINTISILSNIYIYSWFYFWFDYSRTFLINFELLIYNQKIHQSSLQKTYSSLILLFQWKDLFASCNFQFINTKNTNNQTCVISNYIASFEIEFDFIIHYKKSYGIVLILNQIFLSQIADQDIYLFVVNYYIIIHEILIIISQFTKKSRYDFSVFNFD